MTMTARTSRLPAVALAPSRSRLQAPIGSQQRTGRARVSLQEPGFRGPTGSERAHRLGFHIADLPSSPRAGQENRTGLPDRLKSGVEGLSGISLADVNVYYNSPKPARLGSLAYAQGNEIHLGPGQERHLPHEAWHVVQQKQGRVRPVKAIGELAINDSPSLESEATVMGAKAQGRSARMPAVEESFSPDIVKPLQSTGKPAQLMKKGFTFYTDMAKWILKLKFENRVAELARAVMLFATEPKNRSKIYSKFNLDERGRKQKSGSRTTDSWLGPNPTGGLDDQRLRGIRFAIPKKVLDSISGEAGDGMSSISPQAQKGTITDQISKTGTLSLLFAAFLVALLLRRQRSA